jgi:CRP-like cAMP-binding protein
VHWDAARVDVSYGTRRAFRRKTFLVAAGFDARSVYWISRGQVRVFLLDEDGTETTTAVLGPGQLVGIEALLGHKVYRSFAEALIPVEACELDAQEVVQRLGDDPLLPAALVGSLAQRLAQASGLVRDVQLLSVAERIADAQQRLLVVLDGEAPALSGVRFAELIQIRPETLTRARRRTPRGPAFATTAPTHAQQHGLALVAGGIQLLRPGDRIFETDLPPRHVCLVVCGRLELSMSRPDGRRLSFDAVGPGDVIGVSSMLGMPEIGLQAEALTDGALHVLDSATLLANIVQDPIEFQRVMGGLFTRLEHAEQRLQIAGATTTRRLQALLSSLESSDSDRRVRKSHAWLARRIGASRESVTRSFAHLKSLHAV